MTANPATKPRCDAWDAPLTEAQRWSAYEKGRRLPWHAVAEWAAREFDLPAPPGRSAWFEFCRRMRRGEGAHRLEQAALARAEAERLAGEAGAASDVAAAFVAMGNEAALRTGSAEDAVAWIRMAKDLLDAAQKDRALALKAESQKLDREKFEAAQRREDAAKAAVKDEKLTEEQRMARLREIYGI